jgi:hypothetical protein
VAETPFGGDPEAYRAAEKAIDEADRAAREMYAAKKAAQ